MKCEIPELRQRELDRERQKRDWELKERQAEEQRRQNEDMMRRQQEDMSLRMHHQEEEMRRRQQENSLFMQVCIGLEISLMWALTWSVSESTAWIALSQAHQLSSLLDQQEQAMGQRGNYDNAPVVDDPMREYEAAAGAF